MADKSLSEKTAEIAGRRNEAGQEIKNYEEAKAQLMAINSAQKQNIAEAKANAAANFKNTQNLGNAGAALAASMPATQQVTVNPATQSILAKYGAGPKVQKSTTSSQQVTKQNVTINNTTNNTTTNNVQAGGGASSAPAAKPVDNTGKFKVWLNNALAQQNEENARREREYEKRNESLGKDSNKILRKLTEFGKSMGERLDPRKIGSSLGSQLKTLLFIFGFQFLASNWTNILKKVASIESSLKRGLEYIGIKKTGGEWTWKPRSSEFIADITAFFTGKESKPGEKSVFEGGFLQGLKTIFLGDGDKDHGVVGLIKEFFQEQGRKRIEAAKTLNFPEVDINNIGETLKGVGKYLGDLLGVFLGDPEAHLKNNITREISKDASNKSMAAAMSTWDELYETEEVTDQNGDTYEADAGVKAVLQGKHKGFTNYTLDSDGKLNKTAEASISQARDLESVFEQAKTTGKIDSDRAAAGFYRLYSAAKDSKKKAVAVNPEFIQSILNEGEINSMLESGKLKKVNYSYVVRDANKEKYDLREEFIKDTLKEGGISLLLKKIPFLGPILTFGGNLNPINLVLKTVGGIRIATDLIMKAIHNWRQNDHRLELVSEDDIKDTDKLTGETADLYEVTDEGMLDLINKQRSKSNLSNITEDQIDLTNSDYYNGFTNSLKSSVKDSKKEDTIRVKKGTTEISNGTGNWEEISLEEYEKRLNANPSQFHKNETDRENWLRDNAKDLISDINSDYSQFSDGSEWGKHRDAAAISNLEIWKKYNGNTPNLIDRGFRSEEDWAKSVGIGFDISGIDTDNIKLTDGSTVKLTEEDIMQGKFDYNKIDKSSLTTKDGMNYSEWLKKNDKFNEEFVNLLKSTAGFRVPDGFNFLLGRKYKSLSADLVKKINTNNIYESDWLSDEYWGNLYEWLGAEPKKSDYKYDSQFVAAHDAWKKKKGLIESSRERVKKLRDEYDELINTSDTRVADARFNRIKTLFNNYNESNKSRIDKVNAAHRYNERVDNDAEFRQRLIDQKVYGIDANYENTDQVKKLEEYHDTVNQNREQFKENLENNAVGSVALKGVRKIKELGGAAAEKIEDLYDNAIKKGKEILNSMGDKVNEFIDYADMSLIRNSAGSMITDKSLVAWAIIQKDWQIGGKGSRFGAGRHNIDNSNAANEDGPFDRFHEGQDIGVPTGTTLYAPFNGFIEYIHNSDKKDGDVSEGGTGIDMKITDLQSKKFIYVCHLSRISPLAKRIYSNKRNKYGDRKPKLSEMSEQDKNDCIIHRGQEIAYSGKSGNETKDGVTRLKMDAYDPHIHLGVGEYGKKGPFDGPFEKPLAGTNGYKGHFYKGEPAPRFYVDPMTWHVNDEGDLANGFLYLNSNDLNAQIVNVESSISKNDPSANGDGLDYSVGEGDEDPNGNNTSDDSNNEGNDGDDDGDKSLASKIWNYIKSLPEKIMNGELWSDIKSTAKKGYETVKDKVAETLNGFVMPEIDDSNISFHNTARDYNGPIYPEFKDFNEYSKYPGVLPPGMTKVQWQKYVWDKTGSLPWDLKIDKEATLRRQNNNTNYTSDTKNIIDKYSIDSNSTNASSTSNTTINEDGTVNNEGNSSSNVTNIDASKTNSFIDEYNNSSSNDNNSSNSSSDTNIVNADNTNINNDSGSDNNTTIVRPEELTPKEISPAVSAITDELKSLILPENNPNAIKDGKTDAQKQLDALEQIAVAQEGVGDKLDRIVKLTGEGAKANAAIVDFTRLVEINTEIMSQLLASIQSKLQKNSTVVESTTKQ